MIQDPRQQSRLFLPLSRRTKAAELWSTHTRLKTSPWALNPRFILEAQMGVSENWGTLFGVPYNKDPTI